MRLCFAFPAIDVIPGLPLGYVDYGLSRFKGRQTSGHGHARACVSFAVCFVNTHEYRVPCIMCTTDGPFHVPSFRPLVLTTRSDERTHALSVAGPPTTGMAVCFSCLACKSNSKIMSEIWKTLGNEEREAYRSRARDDQKRYKAEQADKVC